jgi:hypothetical protein
MFRSMTGWKKAVLQAAVFGAAFAAVLCLIVGAWTWYFAHRSWNGTAIQATYKDLTLTTFPSHQSMKEDFSYVLENTTNADYSLNSSTVVLMTTLPDGKGLEQRHDFTFSSTEIPAKQKVVLTISQDLDFQGDQNDLAAISAFTNRKLKHLDGFVLFDEAHRYKIILPNGWPNLRPTAP